MPPSFKVLSCLSEITPNYNGILLDAYGVFWGGNETGVLPGAVGMMEKLVSEGKVVGILSNATQLASKEISKLASHGILEGRHYHFLITSGEVARSVFLKERLPFATPRKTYWLFGGIHPRFSSHEAIFQGTGYRETLDCNEADFIYVSIPHLEGEDQIDPEVFRDAIEKIRSKNLSMICTNPDLFAHEGKPPKAVVRQGSIAKIYEEMGGSVFYIGKPYKIAYNAVMEQYILRNVADEKDILMVGDTPETDIRGARDCGMSSLLVTETGIMADRIARKGFDVAFKELPDNDIPNYIVGRFNHGICSSR